VVEGNARPGNSAHGSAISYAAGGAAAYACWALVQYLVVLGTLRQRGAVPAVHVAAGNYKRMRSQDAVMHVLYDVHAEHSTGSIVLENWHP